VLNDFGFHEFGIPLNPIKADLSEPVIELDHSLNSHIIERFKAAHLRKRWRKEKKPISVG
jgi:hypothetical protein